MTKAKPRRHHQGRVAWVEMRRTVEKELAQGWSARAVYDRHPAEFEGRLSYTQFTRYVRELREKEAPPDPKPRLTADKLASALAPLPSARGQTPSELPKPDIEVEDDLPPKPKPEFGFVTRKGKS